MKKRIIIGVIIIFAILASGYAYKYWQNKKRAAERPVPGPIVVPIETATSAIWHERVQTIGTVESKRGVTLKAEIAGRITAIYQPSGKFVRQGTPLFQIYPNTLIAERDAQIAKLKLSQYNYTRALTLYQEGAVSQRYYEQKSEMYRQNEATLRRLESELSLTTIRAPFDGKLGLRHIEKGDYVDQGETIATFQATHDLRIVFAVPGIFADEVKPGLVVSFTPTTANAKTYQSTVYAVNPLIDNKTRMLTVWANVGQARLTPGTYVNVTLNLPKPMQVTLIPQTALLHSTFGNYVFIVRNGKAQKVLVKTGERRGRVVSILSGLTPGEKVISGGQVQIRSGSEVTTHGAIPLPTDGSPIHKDQSGRH